MKLRVFNYLFEFASKEQCNKACNYYNYVRCGGNGLEEFENILNINNIIYTKKAL